MRKSHMHLLSTHLINVHDYKTSFVRRPRQLAAICCKEFKFQTTSCNIAQRKTLVFRQPKPYINQNTKIILIVVNTAVT